MSGKKKINLGFISGDTLITKAKKTMQEYGTTSLYSTGDAILDEYLGNSLDGGYGRRGGYEIVTIFGSTGMNKSTLATSMVLSPAEKGIQIAYFALEDDPEDVIRRMLVMCDMDEAKLKKVAQNILFMPESDGYTLGEMAEAIEKIFDMADIVVVDPLQFVFEASVAEKGETEFNRQRLFMRRMNNVMKHTNKTLIIVSHTGKGGGKDARQGIDRIIGSSAVAQVSTKVIEIDRKDGIHGIRLWKSRFTPFRWCGVQIKLDNMRVRTVYSSEDLPQARLNWTGGGLEKQNGRKEC